MKSVRQRWFSLVAVLSLSGGAFLALWLIARAGASNESAWQLSVAVSSKRVLPAEPVLTTVRLAYLGTAEFVGYASFGRCALNYAAPSGARRGFSLSSPPFAGLADEVPPATAAVYAPGYSTEANVMLLYDTGQKAYFFGEPGLGLLKCRCEVWQGARLEEYQPVSIVSAPVRIQALPLPDGEAPAFASWAGREKAEMFLTGLGDQGTLAELQSLADLYPQSAYAKYALMALAQHKRWQRESLYGPEPEFASLVAEEVDLLEQVVERCPSFHLTPVVLDRLIEASVMVADRSRVEKYAKMLRALPNVPEQFRSRAEGALARIEAKR